MVCRTILFEVRTASQFFIRYASVIPCRICQDGPLLKIQFDPCLSFKRLHTVRIRFRTRSDNSFFRLRRIHRPLLNLIVVRDARGTEVDRDICYIGLSGFDLIAFRRSSDDSVRHTSGIDLHAVVDLECLVWFGNDHDVHVFLHVCNRQ